MNFLCGFVAAWVLLSLHRRLRRNRYGELHITIDRAALIEAIERVGIGSFEQSLEETIQPRESLCIRTLSGVLWLHQCKTEIRLGRASDGFVRLAVLQVPADPQGMFELTLAIDTSGGHDHDARRLTLARFPMREWERYVTEGTKDMWFESTHKLVARLTNLEREAQTAIRAVAPDAQFADDLVDGVQLGPAHVRYVQVLSYSPG